MDKPHAEQAMKKTYKSLFTQRRFSNDTTSTGKDVNDLTIGRTKKHLKVLPSGNTMTKKPQTQFPAHFQPQPYQPQQMLLQQQQQQQMLLQQQQQMLLLQQQRSPQRKGFPSPKTRPKYFANVQITHVKQDRGQPGSRLYRAASQGTLSETMIPFFNPPNDSDDDSVLENKWRDKDTAVAFHTGGARSEWQENRQANSATESSDDGVGSYVFDKNPPRQFPGWSTLPNLGKNKYKSETNLRDIKFNQEPPALPPRNNPFKNACVRRVTIEKSFLGDYGVSVDCSKIDKFIGGFSSHAHNFPFIAKIDQKGRAAKTSLKIGDYLLKINQNSTEGISSKQLDAIIKFSYKKIVLTVATMPTQKEGDGKPPPSPKVPLSMVQQPVTKKPSNSFGNSVSGRIYEELDEKSINDVNPENVNKDSFLCRIITANHGAPIHAKCSASVSENSSGFVSEADSPENSSSGSVTSSLSAAIEAKQSASQWSPNNQPENHFATEVKAQAVTTSGKHLDVPPPLPPKLKTLTQSKIKKPIVLYKTPIKIPDSEKVLDQNKFPTVIQLLPQKIDVALIKPEEPRMQEKVPIIPPPPAVWPKRFGGRKQTDVNSDEIFLEKYPNPTHSILNVVDSTGVDSYPSLSDQDFPSFHSNESISPTQQSLKKNFIDVSSTNFSKSSPIRDSMVPLLLPPEDFSDTVAIELERQSLLDHTKEISIDDTIAHKTAKKIITNKNNMENWLIGQVVNWLSSIGMEDNVVNNFAVNGVDGKTLLGLKRADLIALGLNKMEARRDLERAIKKVQMKIL